MYWIGVFAGICVGVTGTLAFLLHLKLMEERRKHREGNDE